MQESENNTIKNANGINMMFIIEISAVTRKSNLYPLLVSDEYPEPEGDNFIYVHKPGGALYIKVRHTKYLSACCRYKTG